MMETLKIVGKFIALAIGLLIVGVALKGATAAIAAEGWAAVQWETLVTAAVAGITAIAIFLQLKETREENRQSRISRAWQTIDRVQEIANQKQGGKSYNIIGLSEALKLLLQEQKKGTLEKSALHGINLAGSTITGVDLSGIDLTKAHLENTRFRYVTLKNAIFRNAYLNAANFERCDLEEADFTDASCQNMTMEACKTKGIHLPHHGMEGARFRSVNLSGQDFYAYNFNYVTFELVFFIQSDMIQASFHYSEMQHSRITEADISGADFSTSFSSSTTIPRLLNQATWDPETPPKLPDGFRVEGQEIVPDGKNP